MTTRYLIHAILLSALALGACGKQGSLDRPAPLLGAKARADYARERAAARQGAAVSSADQSANSQTNGDYSQSPDGAKDPALKPSRSDPTQGAAPNPFEGRVGGALPDPFADPNSAPR